MVASPVEEIIGKKTLIVGDVGSGKTGLTETYVKALAKRGLEAVFVLDLAPGAVLPDGAEVGQAMDVAGISGISYKRVEPLPPRLTTEVEDARFKIAQDNARKIKEDGLSRLPVRGVDAIVINDASLFLQAEEPETLLKYLEGAGTVLLNAYLGEYFGPGPFSDREREKVERLCDLVDLVIRL